MRLSYRRYITFTLLFGANSIAWAHGSDMRVLLIFPMSLLAAMLTPITSFYAKKLGRVNTLVSLVIAFPISVVLITLVVLVISGGEISINKFEAFIKELFTSALGAYLVVAVAIVWKPVLWSLNKLHVK